jgi:hypothetical protein
MVESWKPLNLGIAGKRLKQPRHILSLSNPPFSAVTQIQILREFEEVIRT